tara:strand:+ start:102 stop:842 length:741 start_codon:yes stop_codon:yes gene_type:complete
MKLQKIKKLIRESIHNLLNEQMSGPCKQCPTGTALLDVGYDFGDMIFTSGQNAGQVTCQQSDNPDGGGPDYCPNWGQQADFPYTQWSGGPNWGCPVGFSTWGGNCNTPVAGGYACPENQWPQCCQYYVPGPHQNSSDGNNSYPYSTITGVPPNVQPYVSYCEDYSEPDTGPAVKPFTDSFGNPVSPVGSGPGGPVNTGGGGGGRLAGKSLKKDPPPTLPPRRVSIGRMSEQINRFKKLAGIKKKRG